MTAGGTAPPSGFQHEELTSEGRLPRPPADHRTLRLARGPRDL
ncbi:MAG TPA: hypothetical protein VNU01_01675 [Egibacteraceae bacterium]|nr:hypothetical protein [Egibacteraceae bacterium]